MDYIAGGMDSSKWYYLRAGQQRGPMNIRALQGLLESGALPPTTLVWTASQPDWQPANATALLGNHKTRAKHKWIKAAAVLFLVLSAGLGVKHFWKREPPTKILGKTIDYSSIQNPPIGQPLGEAVNIQPGKQRLLDQYNLLQRDHGHLQAAFAKLQYNVEEKNSEKTLSAATLLKLQEANKTLSEQINALKENQADPLIRTKLAGITRQLVELKKKHTQSEQKNRELERQLQQNQSNPSQAKLTQLADQLSNKNSRIATLEEQLQILRTTLSTIQNIRSTPPDKPLSPIARVSSVDVKKGVVVLDRGSNTGFSNGNTLRIISRRTKAFLGYAHLRQVLTLRTIANFEGKDITSIKPGDYISR
jgi:hypothetical protein